MSAVKLSPDDAGYPRSLFRLDMPPTLTVSGPLDTERRVVAIVGSREASTGAQGFAFQLAYHLARAGVIVASGGAVGIDRAAHQGAQHGGGTTWLVSPTGQGVVFPPVHRELFRSLEASETARIIWPFPSGTRKDKHTPRIRNGVLVALSECVVVIQAKLRSGSRNAATWGRRLGRRVFVVPGMPWLDEFKGSLEEGGAGAEALWSVEWFFDALGLPPPDMNDPAAAYEGMLLTPSSIRRRLPPPQYAERPLFPLDPSAWNDDEKIVFSMLSLAPTQQDKIVERVGLPTSSTLTALLTLSLKDVVVEGPDGFFRRRIAL